jgi:hypothetical protein
MKKLRESVEPCKTSGAVLGSLSRSFESQCEPKGDETFGKQARVRRIDILELEALVEQVVRVQRQQAAPIRQAITHECIQHEEPIFSIC